MLSIFSIVGETMSQESSTETIRINGNSFPKDSKMELDLSKWVTSNINRYNWNKIKLIVINFDRVIISGGGLPNLCKLYIYKCNTIDVWGPLKLQLCALQANTINWYSTTDIAKLFVRTTNLHIHNYKQFTNFGHVILHVTNCWIQLGYIFDLNIKIIGLIDTVRIISLQPKQYKLTTKNFNKLILENIKEFRKSFVFNVGPFHMQFDFLEALDTTVFLKMYTDYINKSARLEPNVQCSRVYSSKPIQISTAVDIYNPQRYGDY